MLPYIPCLNDIHLPIFKHSWLCVLVPCRRSTPSHMTPHDYANSFPMCGVRVCMYACACVSIFIACYMGDLVTAYSDSRTITQSCTMVSRVGMVHHPPLVSAHFSSHQKRYSKATFEDHSYQILHHGPGRPPIFHALAVARAGQDACFVQLCKEGGRGGEDS